MLISFLSQKGGVGKSSLAAHLVGYLAESRGFDVEAADADPGQGLSLWIRQALPAVKVRRALTVEEIMELEASGDGYLIADGPAGTSPASRALAVRSGLVVVPLNPGPLDLQAARSTLELIAQVKKTRKDGGPAALVVVNQFRPTLAAREILELAGGLGAPLAAAVVSLRVAIVDSFGTFTWRLGAVAAPAAEEIEALCSEILKNAKKAL